MNLHPGCLCIECSSTSIQRHQFSPWLTSLGVSFSNCTLASNYAPINIKLEEGGGWAKARDSTKEVTLDCCNCLNFFFRVQVTGVLLLVNDSPFKWPCRQTLGCIYQCLCCFLSPSKFPFCKITSQKWLFNTCYGKIDLLNQNPIDQKLYACWRHPVPLNWPLDAQFRVASLPQYRG